MMKIYVRNGQFFADGFAVRRAFSLAEGEERYLSYVAEGGCGCTTVALREGALITEGSVEVILRGEDAEIRPLSCAAISTVRRMTLTKGKESYYIECRAAGCSMIRITGSAEAEWQTRTPLLSPAIRSIDGQRDTIVEVTADCPEGRYLLLFSLTKGNAKLLLEECGESVICHGNEVTVRRSLPDLRGREITIRYVWKGEGFTSSREVVCTRDLPVGENIGRLLLESVIAGDLLSLRELLSPENDVETVLAYFGEICSVEPPLSPDHTTAVTVIARREGRKVYVTYDFDLDPSGRVENIRILNE